jgi:DNA-binding response OmpR family regulator
MRLLLVEDDAGIARFVRQGLREAGYEVDWEKEGQRGLERALSGAFDLVVLDVLIPGLNGLELLAQLRAQDTTTPVLLLTALDTIEDRVKGLDSGADDYLVKPFAFPELLARVRALLRRNPQELAPALKVGAIEMDLVRREVKDGGRSVLLSRREFALLEYLMRHPGEVLTRTQIAERVWGFDFYNESNVIDVYVGYLRKKLGHTAERPVIRTVWGTGFVLEAEDV